jgi:hypothetical protein
MKLLVKAGATSKLVRIFIQDSSKSDGSGLTGLLYNSSGLTWSYVREDQNAATVVTKSSATLGTWTSGGFSEVDPTNLPGFYEIGLPNAALASGQSVQMLLFGATKMVPCPIEIELEAVNRQSATAFITSVPAVAGTVTANVTQFAGQAVQLDANNLPGVNIVDVLGTAAQASSGAIDANLISVNGTMFSGADVPTSIGGGSDPWATALPGSYGAGTAGAILGSTVPAIKAKTDILPAGFPSNFASLGITSTGKISDVALCDTLTTYSGNTPQSGDLYAVVNPMVTAHVFTGQSLANAPIGSGGGASLAAIQGELDTRGLTATTTALVMTNLDSKVSTRSTYAGGVVAGVSSPVTVGTNQDKAGYALSTSGLDAIQIENGINARQALSPILAACAGVIIGAGTGTIVIKGGNSPITRITASTDNAGNRTAVTVSLPA